MESGGPARRNVVVFVLDSQADPAFIAGRMPAPEDTNPPSHGSIVARIVRMNCGRCRIITLTAENVFGEILREYYLKALRTVLEYAESHKDEAVLVNVSLGSPVYDPEEHGLIKRLHSRGVVIVAATGNEDSAAPVYPAACKEVVAVANASGKGKAESSNYGDYVDISADGDVSFLETDILPYESITRELKARGTSFSAAKVTGLIATVLSRRPDLTTADAVSIVRHSTRPMFGDMYYRKGMLGAGLACRYGALSAIDPLHRIKVWAGPVAAALLLLGSTIILCVMFGGWGIYVSLGLWLFLFPAVLYMALVTYDVGIIASKWVPRSGIGVKEVVMVLITAPILCAIARWRPRRLLLSAAAAAALLIGIGWGLHVTLPPMLRISVFTSVAIVILAGVRLLDIRMIARIRHATQIWGEGAVDVLVCRYDRARDVEVKSMIIQTLGEIPDDQSVSFLLETWVEEWNKQSSLQDRRRGRRRRSSNYDKLNERFEGALVKIALANIRPVLVWLDAVENMGFPVKYRLFDIIARTGNPAAIPYLEAKLAQMEASDELHWECRRAIEDLEKKQ